ncbi:MAG: GNAT family N-acetyltransferase [Cyanothece sp. SIO2G6]|nr:GNAT family N-acetyltransferase [Cyanothece sp. SIO2G6]
MRTLTAMPENHQNPLLLCTLDLTQVCVDGPRVRLQSISEEFAAPILREFSAEITRFMLPKPTETMEQAQDFIRSSTAGMVAKREIVFAILNNDTAEFLGCCGIHGQVDPRTPELGIWLKKSAHGQKLGREAIALACHWAWAHIDFDYLVYPVDRANIPSRKIPESMGGVIFEQKRVKTMRGTELDEIVFKISPEAIPKAMAAIASPRTTHCSDRCSRGASQFCNLTPLSLNPSPRTGEGLQPGPPSPILGEGAGG